MTGGVVTFSGTYIFESDGLRLTPSSSLRFRSREEVEPRRWPRLVSS